MHVVDLVDLSCSLLVVLAIATAIRKHALQFVLEGTGVHTQVES